MTQQAGVETLKVVIVGAGRSGRGLRADYFNLLPETEVIAFCDPDLEQAREAAAQKGAPHAFANLDEALEAVAPDVVAICSPPEFHCEQACQALAAGVHVLLEKPMVVALDELERVKIAAEASRGSLTVVHNQKFDQGIQKAVRAVADGAVGRVLSVDRTWMRSGDEDRMMPQRDYWAHRLAGGRWGETLPHDLYIAYQFLGPMTLVSVDGRQTHRRWPWLPLDEVKVMLTNGSAYCSLQYSLAVDKGLTRPMLITGTRGAMLVDEARVETLGHRRRQHPVKALARAGADVAKLPLKLGRRAAGKIARDFGLGRATPSRPRSGQFRMVEGFVHSLTGKGPRAVSWEEAEDTMRLALDVGNAIDAVSRRLA